VVCCIWLLLLLLLWLLHVACMVLRLQASVVLFCFELTIDKCVVTAAAATDFLVIADALLLLMLQCVASLCLIFNDSKVLQFLVI